MSNWIEKRMFDLRIYLEANPGDTDAQKDLRVFEVLKLAEAVLKTIDFYEGLLPVYIKADLKEALAAFDTLKRETEND